MEYQKYEVAGHYDVLGDIPGADDNQKAINKGTRK